MSMRVGTRARSLGAWVGVRSMPRKAWSDVPPALPEPAELSGTEWTSSEFDCAEALERVAVRRQHLSFRTPLPYFHNGIAATPEDVVDLYRTSLGFVFTPQESADLVAFFRAL
jgi:hypothetical protein